MVKRLMAGSIQSMALLGEGDSHPSWTVYDFITFLGVGHHSILTCFRFIILH